MTLTATGIDICFMHLLAKVFYFTISRSHEISIYLFSGAPAAIDHEYATGDHG